MKLDEFRRRLDADGADMAAWPQVQRAAAERLVASEPAAQAALRAAQRLDRLIARGLASVPSPDATRVLATLALPPQRRPFLSWAWPAALLDVDLAPARLRIAALAAVAVLGIALGLLGPDVTDAGLAAPTETNLAAVFEPEPLTGVRP